MKISNSVDTNTAGQVTPGNEELRSRSDYIGYTLIHYSISTTPAMSFEQWKAHRDSIKALRLGEG